MTRPRALQFRLPALVALLAIAGSTSASAASPPARRIPAVAPAPAKHMLFKVRGPNGATVYLLGSVHLLTAEAGKLPAEVDSAFAHSKTVAFETSLDTVQLRGAELLTRGRYPNGATLRSSLTPGGVTKADSVLHLYGLSIDQLNQFKPWFVSIAMTQLVMAKAGFQAQYGVDIQLNARAKKAGKPVMSLETVDFQLGIFDMISPEDQEKMLTTSPGPDSSSRVMAQIKDAWLAGSTGALDTLLNRAAAESPAFFTTMIANRNKSWVPKIESLLKGTDDVLVVVGAAHLVGKEGVLELLKAKGYSIEQM